ncbi:MAG: ABC transporter substrate-binding protein [Acidimicrobiales bacterium]
MRTPRLRHVGPVLVAGALLAACGNAAVTTSTSGNSAGVSRNRIVVGALASLTGPLPADFAPAIAGAQAYFDTVNANGGVNGRRIDLAHRLDDQSNPSSDAGAARTLVDQDHVFAVVPVATPSFAGGPFLASHDVPTFGLDVNPNSDWAGSSMYGTTGSYNNYKGAQLQAAYLAELHHVKNAAVIAYNIAQSVQGCDSVLIAFKKYGIHLAFKDLSVPVPAFNLNADVTRMKAHHTDMVVSCLDLTGNVLLAHTMAQQGLTGVTQFWYDGYDESALKQFSSVMQGVYFFLSNVPFEVTKLAPGKYPGMDNFVTAMARYEPHEQPSEAALSGWQSADLFVTGLKRLGRDVTRTRLIAALNRIPDYTANGIDAPIDWQSAHSPAPGPTNCGAFVQVRGERFVPVYGTPPSVFSCLPVPDPKHAPLVPITPLPKGVPPLKGSLASG